MGGQAEADWCSGTVLHDYTAAHADELSVRRGDAVMLRMLAEEPGWAEGQRLATSVTGLLPLSHVHCRTRVAVWPAGAAHLETPAPHHALLAVPIRRAAPAGVRCTQPSYAREDQVDG